VLSLKTVLFDLPSLLQLVAQCSKLI